MEIYEKRIKKTNRFFLVLVILYLVFSFVIQYFTQSTILHSCLLELSLFVIGVVFLLCWKVNIKDYLRLKKVDFISILLSILYGICLIPIVAVINAISMLFVENVASSSVSDMVDQGFLISFVVIAIIPAIVEEFLFRGIIYRGYRQARPIRGMVYSALLFGALHMNFNQLCYAFFMGIALAVLDEVTDSLIPSMIVHCLFNGQSVCLIYVLKLTEQLVNGMGNASTTVLNQSGIFAALLVYLPFAIGGAVLGIVLLAALAKRNHRYEYMMTWFSREYKGERERLPRPRIVSVSLVLAVLICLGVCVMIEVV